MRRGAPRGAAVTAVQGNTPVLMTSTPQSRPPQPPLPVPKATIQHAAPWAWLLAHHPTPPALVTQAAPGIVLQGILDADARFRLAVDAGRPRQLPSAGGVGAGAECVADGAGEPAD